MKVFKINDAFSIICESWNTKSAWGHKASIVDVGGKVYDVIKFRYYNRTWERWQYESILLQAFHNLEKKYSDIVPLKDRYQFYKSIKEKQY